LFVLCSVLWQAICLPIYDDFGARRVLLGCSIPVIHFAPCIACVSRLASNIHPYAFLDANYLGLGMGGFFALAGTASINDIYKVDERGWRVGLWNFAVIVSVNLTPVISSNVISALSWRWAFWLQAIQFGVLLAAVILFFPETTFHREISGSPPTPANVEKSSDDNTLDNPNLDAEEKGGLPVVTSASTESIPFKSNNSLLIFIEPLAIVIDPIVIWVSIMWSISFTWTILLGAVASQIFTAPPYNMSTVAVGNLAGIAPLIGSALGTMIGGFLCDLSSKSLAGKNDGIYEPEFRLPVMLPAALTMLAGAFGLGAATQYGLSAEICGVFMAILNFGVGMACTGIVAYTNDACGQRAGDCFGLAMVAKSAFAFGLSFVFNNFIDKSGPLIFFSTFGALSLAVMLTTIPLFIWGKQIRAWADERDLLRRRNCMYLTMGR
jgi:MFS family permease